MRDLKIPVGTSDFAKIRENGYYYIDKTDLIQKLLETESTEVMLITRPRRFGKTLGMSMLAEFFDIRKDSKNLFAGLKITENKELCDKWMNQWPTLFLSFKSVAGTEFADAYAMLVAVISEFYKQHLYLLDSDKISMYDKTLFDKIASKKMSLEEVKNSLLKLTQMLQAHYGKKVIVLIDEYDVPLAKASESSQADYYNDMLDAIKGVMQALKDNASLRFSVVTGCLRIAKESIFTGTNNFKSDTISDTRLSEYFGFTEQEVHDLLADAGFVDSADKIRTWYDGYHFGDVDVYCPWDVLSYAEELINNPQAEPKNFWENTSDNAIVGTFLNRTDLVINEKFETLLNGGYIKESIVENLTYDVLKSSEDNLWSLLYLTGYLTKARADEVPGHELMPDQIALKIPNAEVMAIFRKSVRKWFGDMSAASDRRDLLAALWNGEAVKLSEMLSDLLFDTISYHDYQESFYHAFLTGLVSNAGCMVESNYENGLGRSDIVIKDRKNRRAIVIEAKTATSEKNLAKECDDALKQIEEKKYAVKVERSGYKKVTRLGLAFFQKMCFVKTP